MTSIGAFVLLVAFIGGLASVVCLFLGHIAQKKDEDRSDMFTFIGSVAALVSTITLTLCCAVLVYCFMTENTSLLYVVKNQSNNSTSLAWLFKLSGLWAGRQGSLLFWAWLISVFNALIAHKVSRRYEQLDSMALMVAQLVLSAFIGVMLFSTDNMPFEALDPQYLDETGALTGTATMWGMNALLEHWAMAIHPPTLFVGYAGMTIPFAYALGALITNDTSVLWVKRAQGYTLFAWLFLGLGIGLGAVWAYVVLGWGGYWGWDPVENASLLPWLVGMALIHSFTVNLRNGGFKRWSIMCACLAFSFVILGTFISRSGLVSSVHAFEGDAVSIVLFLVLIIASLVAGIVGLFLRRDSFAQDREKLAQEQGVTQSLASKEISYYANNLVLVVCSILLAYLTLTSALPSPLPLAGMSVSTGTYNAIARPLGIIYCLLMASCPLLSWRKTDKKVFAKQIKIPALCSLVLFALLVVLFFTKLYPNYTAALEQGGSVAEAYTIYGPSWYYNGLALLGLLVASLLFCTSLMVLVRMFKSGTKTWRGWGGMISHVAMAIILIGLIGSSMYVSEKTVYLQYDKDSDSVSQKLEINDYALEYLDYDARVLDNGDDVCYTLNYQVNKGDDNLTTVQPQIQIVQSTFQQKLVASVVHRPFEDLFVVFQGVTDTNQFIMNIKVNPLISFVWIGFALLMIGTLLSTFSKAQSKERS